MSLRMVLVASLIVGGLGLAGYIRLAPHDAGRWHLPLGDTPAQLGLVSEPGGVRALVAAEDPAAALARLADVIEATSRVTRLAGDLGSGRITWVIRSAFWGFPDYLTAEISPQGVRIWSRLRFGRSDLGVNRARLERWLAEF
jgi:hypothetical protein